MRELARQLGFGIPTLDKAGSPTDVANLVFAMRGEPPAGELSEREVVEAIDEVSDKIARGDFSGLWVPTHLVHDAEEPRVAAPRCTSPPRRRAAAPLRCRRRRSRWWRPCRHSGLRR